MLWKDAFAGCTALKHIEFQASSTPLSLITESENPSDAILLQDCPLESVILNRPCSNLAKYKPFRGKTTLKSVVLGANYKEIANYLLADCTALTSLSLPAGLVQIPNSMCEGCTSLRSIAVPEGVTAINVYAFRNCSQATSISLPSTLTTINDLAFDGCSAITSLTIPEGVAGIKQEAFANCSSLNFLSLPSTLLYIDQMAFGTPHNSPLSNARPQLHRKSTP